ncbi:MAG: nuclear transport factor 2 family protein [Taibaiella sp.]|nr:nuclear transport factor 2 family protein [Taibaiella sp.]
MNKICIFIICIMLSLSFNSFGQNTKSGTEIKNQLGLKSLEIVNKYLNIIFVENKNGEGLSDILATEFVFDDPFSPARGAKDFISKTQNWIRAKKSIKIEKQFVDRNSVCSIYNIAVVTPSGDTADFKLTDYVKLLDGKIVMEQVFFADPVKFAKALGFMDSYINKYKQ